MEIITNILPSESGFRPLFANVEKGIRYTLILPEAILGPESAED